jgi:hypothetical protein
MPPQIDRIVEVIHEFNRGFYLLPGPGVEFCVSEYGWIQERRRRRKREVGGRRRERWER